MKICEIMEKHDIKVTFKIVGEKLRALKANGRSDVIEAMGRHDIGYHSNLHSVHPTISEFVGNLDWDEAEEIFFKKKIPGWKKFERRTGGSLSCYGHPSMCWVPEAYPSLHKWKIDVYLDETNSITPLNERPYYYCNVLNIMGLGQKIVPLDASDGPRKLPPEYLTTLIPSIEEMYPELRNSGEPEIPEHVLSPDYVCDGRILGHCEFCKGEKSVHGKLCALEGKVPGADGAGPGKAREICDIPWITSRCALYHGERRARNIRG